MSPTRPHNVPGWFDAFRDGDWSTYYDPIRTPAIADYKVVCVVYAWGILAFASFFVVLGTRRDELLQTVFRMALSGNVGFVVLLAMVASDWLTASGHVVSYYGLTSDQKVDADIGVHVGLSSVNVTLRGNFLNQSGDFFFNDKISWWEVHQAEHEYDLALSKGPPIPLMEAEETFGIGFDQFDINKSLELRTAGYYTYVLMCFGLASWIVTNVMKYILIWETAIMFILSGVVFLLANLCYYTAQPRDPIVIHVEGARLQLTFGYCFYLNLAAGIISLVVGIVLYVVGRSAPDKVVLFFDITNDNVLMVVKARQTGRVQDYQEEEQELQPVSLANTTIFEVDDHNKDGGDEREVETDIDANGEPNSRPRSVEFDAFRQISI